jgi:hypothetical protein
MIQIVHLLWETNNFAAHLDVLILLIRIRCRDAGCCALQLYIWRVKKPIDQ